MKQVLQMAAVDWERYTHIAFTSRNGINAFLDALEARYGSDQALAKLRNSSSRTTFCALGADAELLHSAGIMDVLTPQEVTVLGTVPFHNGRVCTHGDKDSSLPHCLQAPPRLAGCSDGEIE